MRIGIFSECYEPVRNGVSTSVRTLVEELRARKHHAVIVAPRHPNQADRAPHILRVPSFVTPFNLDYPVAFPWFPRLRREFRRIGTEVLHSHSPFFLGLLALRLARQLDLPLVSTYHTLYDQYAHYLFFLPRPTTRRLLRWWLPAYYNRCAVVIAPSRVAERSLRQYGVTAPVAIIPTAVPLPSPESVGEAAQRAARARWAIPPTAPLLLYAGRIAREKSLELVLDAFAAVADEWPEARLLIVGGGPHLAAVRRSAQAMGCGPRIVLAGPMPRNQLDPVFAAADLFVFGSSTETQGLVIAEARAAGTPCVVVDRGGAAETVRHGEDGLIVPPEVGPFAEAVRALLRDDARRHAMREACLRNARHYTPSAMAERVMEVYEQALHWKRSAQPLANRRKWVA